MTKDQKIIEVYRASISSLHAIMNNLEFSEIEEPDIRLMTVPTSLALFNVVEAVVESDTPESRSLDIDWVKQAVEAEIGK